MSNSSGNMLAVLRRSTFLVMMVLALSQLANAVRQEDDLHQELRVLAAADQEDRKQDWGRLSKVQMATFAERDAARLSRVRVLLREGKITSVEDFDNASLIFQHGTTANDYLTAHELSLIRLLKSPRIADNLVVLSEDRFLQKIGRRQRFGTQGTLVGNSTRRMLPQPVLENSPFAVTDGLRADLFLPTLALYKQNGPRLPTNAFESVTRRLRQRYDPKWIAEASSKLESKELARIAARKNVGVSEREQVLKWYRADLLRTPADYKNAAAILLMATQSDESNSEQEADAYLLAHELAMVSALREKSDEATALAATAMDRFLVCVGLEARYTTSADRASAIEPASASVRREFGIR